MTLYIHQAYSPATTIEWHTDDMSSRFPYVDMKMVDWIEADGEDLMFIRHNFANIPTPLGQLVVRWPGELARFILTCLSMWNTLPRSMQSVEVHAKR